MKLTFLGTAAATSYPLAFCKCDFCNQARKSGGKDLRKRSSLLISDDLLIDLGPDIVSASFAYNFSVAEIRYWLQPTRIPTISMRVYYQHAIQIST